MRISIMQMPFLQRPGFEKTERIRLLVRIEKTKKEEFFLRQNELLTNMCLKIRFQIKWTYQSILAHSLVSDGIVQHPKNMPGILDQSQKTR